MAGETEKRILIGTSGYSYQDWVGPVYPAGTQPQDYLAHYATHFDVVELNFSYYAQPRPAQLEKMLQATPASFLYIIKAHKSLTHDFSDHNSPADWERSVSTFKQGITPLRESGRLATVLFQFPYSFHYTDDSRLYLDAVCRAFSDYPVSIEFRNDEWQREAVYKEFTNRQLTFVNVDTPELARLPRPEAIHTSALGYVRFHGKNKENWWKGDNVTRYDYLYSLPELNSWLPKIVQMIAKVKLLLLIFNNHFKGQSFKNAFELQGLIKQRGLL